MRSRSEAGAALVIALMLTALLTFIGGALLYLVDLETAISANHHAAHDLRDAAESGIECAIAELAALPGWADVANGTVNPVLQCLDPAPPARSPDGTPLNLAQLTASVQAWSDRRHGPLAENPDSPSWSEPSDSTASSPNTSDRIVPKRSTCVPPALVATSPPTVQLPRAPSVSGNRLPIASACS